jgi:hypothetical protein
MSYDVDVFVQGSTVEAIVQVLRTRFGTETVREETVFGSIWVADVFGLGLTVLEHDLEDDLGLPFTQYPHQVGFHLAWGRMYSSASALTCRAMAADVAAALRENIGANCLIVEDVQMLLDDDESIVRGRRRASR